MKQRILIIEDDSFLAGIYAKKMELEGFEVSFASSGEDGLKLAAKDRPDLIVLDLRLQPDRMDGFEVLEKLKGDADLTSVPVLVLTNLGQKEDIDRCLRLGAAGYIIKAHALPHETMRRIKEILHANV